MTEFQVNQADKALPEQGVPHNVIVLAEEKKTNTSLYNHSLETNSNTEFKEFSKSLPTYSICPSSSLEIISDISNINFRSSKQRPLTWDSTKSLRNKNLASSVSSLAVHRSNRSSSSLDRKKPQHLLVSTNFGDFLVGPDFGNIESNESISQPNYEAKEKRKDAISASFDSEIGPVQSKLLSTPFSSGLDLFFAELQDLVPMNDSQISNTLNFPKNSL
ncbi:hypothetical protein HK100_012136 [Physocladia obscura]|uniref:Uncharacterized protein n=1 Tax=Physocladia obscura TaxID=109957 RepID=A0AAD5T2T4_9FUNG|nr:hypothetical protein HK100_012136 [Physocladia obscura]